MITGIHKQKISKDYSFLMKTRKIEELILDNDILTDVDLTFGGLRKDWIFGANYSPPGEYYNSERLLISIGAVQRDIVQVARECLLKEAIPVFVKWIKDIERLDLNSPLYKQRRFSVRFQVDKVSIDYD